MMCAPPYTLWLSSSKPARGPWCVCASHR
jgi:hypothetical protein